MPSSKPPAGHSDPGAPLPDALMEHFFGLCLLLHPEHPEAVPTLTPAQEDQRLQRLGAEWAALERQAGRPVSEGEVYRWLARRGSHYQ